MWVRDVFNISEGAEPGSRSREEKPVEIKTRTYCTDVEMRRRRAPGVGNWRELM